MTSYYRWNFEDNKKSETTFAEWLRADDNIVSFSFSKGIIALFESGQWVWTDVTKKLDNKLRGRQKELPSPTLVATEPGNRYFIQFAEGVPNWRASRAFSEALGRHPSVEVTRVAFAPKGGWYLLFKDGSEEWRLLPKKLQKLLDQNKLLEQNKKKITKDISISPNGHWFISYSDGTYDENLPDLCSREYKSLVEEYNVNIGHVWLGRNGQFCIAYTISDETPLQRLSPQKISFSKASIPAADTISDETPLQRLSPQKISFSKVSIPVADTISDETPLQRLSPWKISFSKAFILANFTNNYSIWRTISDLEKKILDSEKIPPIRVIRKNNTWITLDNHQLFAFQNGGVSSIPVIVLEKSLAEVDQWPSVTVLPCICDACNFFKTSTSWCVPSQKEIQSMNDTSARSWSWQHSRQDPSAPLFGNYSPANFTLTKSIDYTISDIRQLSSEMMEDKSKKIDILPPEYFQHIDLPLIG